MTEWCYDRRRHEREGEDAARRDPGHRFDHDYRERERNARHEPHGCDAAYIRGFEDQRRRDDEEREQREDAERREERERRLIEECSREDDEFYGKRDTDD